MADAVECIDVKLKDSKTALNSNINVNLFQSKEIKEILLLAKTLLEDNKNKQIAKIIQECTDKEFINHHELFLVCSYLCSMNHRVSYYDISKSSRFYFRKPSSRSKPNILITQNIEEYDERLDVKHALGAVNVLLSVASVFFACFYLGELVHWDVGLRVLMALFLGLVVGIAEGYWFVKDLSKK